MTGKPGLPGPSCQNRGTEAGDSTQTPHRHPDEADSARPEHGALARRKYGLMATEDPAGDAAAVVTQVIRDGHEVKDTENQD